MARRVRPTASPRGRIEAFLDLLGWAWDGGLSCLLDQAVLEEEAA